MGALEGEVIRTGSPQSAPASTQLRGGPLTITLAEGALRSIHLGSREVLRGLYAAVRDHNWGTIAPRFLSYEVEAQTNAFQVRFEAEHVNAEVDFVWQGTITGSSAGEVVFTFDGQARRAFRKNRIGFCILHPMELAGAALEVETPHGMIQSVFPEQISPHQPFKEIVAMRYTCATAQAGEPEIHMELRCSGELFEMEDQRNWTDASYKTYCTSLDLPYPVQIAAGERITQSITLHPLSYPVGPGTHSQEQSIVSVSLAGVGSLPALGFASTRHNMPFDTGASAYLRALSPAYLWTELDLARADWQETLRRAREDASLLQAELELSVVCDDAGGELAPLFHMLAEQRIAVARLSCFSRSSHVTTRAMLEQARAHRSGAGLDMKLGAGSRANFAELNRAVLPLDLAELVEYPINPQVHAFDDLSLLETLPAQAVTARDAQRIAAGLPLSVGPITLKPRFNAVATSTEDLAAAEQTPASVDARQISLFGAGWTVGSLRHLATSGASWLTYYELSGWRGLLEQEQEQRPASSFPSIPGALFPLYHVFADLADFRQGEVLRVEINAPQSVEALALCQGQRVLLLLANLSAIRQTLHLQLPALTRLTARMLDENSALEAMYEPARFRSRRQALVESQPGEIALDLLPYALVHIEGYREDT